MAILIERAARTAVCQLLLWGPELMALRYLSIVPLIGAKFG